MIFGSRQISHEVKPLPDGRFAWRVIDVQGFMDPTMTGILAAGIELTHDVAQAQGQQAADAWRAALS